MRKKITYYFVITCIIVLGTAGVKSGYNSGVPPAGYTGVNAGTYCTNCHSDFGLNSGGGSVTVSGLPTTNYVKGQAYPFSITISHGTADRKRWGFAIKAVNTSTNASVGSFTTSNNKTGVSNSELGHRNPTISATGAGSFTYNNLMWTAPSTSPPTSVTFYFVGNAADGTGGSDNDYIYAGFPCNCFCLFCFLKFRYSLV